MCSEDVSQGRRSSQWPELAQLEQQNEQLLCGFVTQSSTCPQGCKQVPARTEGEGGQVLHTRGPSGARAPPGAGPPLPWPAGVGGPA